MPLHAAATMALTVAQIREEADEIRSFELRDPAGRALPAFTAGSHLTVAVPLPDGQTASRHYSLCSDPRDRSRYRIAVLREHAGRGGSRFLHTQVQRGDTLQVTAPDNGFPLAPEATHSVLIAGGIGITPVVSMMHALAHQGGSYEVHYAARTPERMAFRTEVEKIAGARAQFYHTGTTAPRRLDLAALLAAPRAGVHVYVCGPGRLLRDVRAVSEANGWPSHRVHTESFGPAARPEDGPVEVYLARSAMTVPVAPDETILDALLAAGVWAPYECRRGSCGSCMTRVIGGDPDHRDTCLSDTLRAAHFCPCVSRAHSTHLTLDL